MNYKSVAGSGRGLICGYCFHRGFNVATL